MTIKAIALLSGGLDSTLAIRVMQEQGIEIIAVNCVTPFCQCTKKGACRHQASVAAEKLGVKIKIIPLQEEYLEMIKDPKHGYGKNMNPCIDCRIMLHKKARELMPELNASFIITGEVLGQRPMSQHKRAIDIIEKESGLQGLILRPLSAKVLPETTPEKMGWVDREKLLDISGRSRKPQIELARVFGIKDYPCPAGGCLLADKGFGQKVRDLIEYDELNIKNVNLLKVGRHFRVAPFVKLVVGRNKEDNEQLLTIAEPEDLVFKSVDFPGPIGLLRGRFDTNGTVSLAASIIARYSDAGARKTRIGLAREHKAEMIEVSACAQDLLEQVRIS